MRRPRSKVQGPSRLSLSVPAVEGKCAAGGSLLALLLVCFLAACATTLSLRPSDLTLDEQVGQLFVPVARGGFVNEESSEYRQLVHQVVANHVGGIHWASGSNVYETAYLNRRLQKLAKVTGLSR